jgi:hypothetical protein
MPPHCGQLFRCVDQRDRFVHRERVTSQLWGCSAVRRDQQDLTQGSQRGRALEPEASQREFGLIKLFAVFCFVLERDKQILLIVSDTYIPEMEFTLFKKINSLSYSDKRQEIQSQCESFFELENTHTHTHW